MSVHDPFLWVRPGETGEVFMKQSFVPVVL